MINFSRKILIFINICSAALSYNQRLGQPDTCWSNVYDDMREEVLDIINELND